MPRPLARPALRSMRAWLVGLVVAGCRPAAPRIPSLDDERQIATTDAEELLALARLYGHVRWFHPSDEAATVDWDAFAVDAAQRVLAAQRRGELQSVLTDLFTPLAPSVVVSLRGTRPASALTAGVHTVEWQHLGFADGREPSPVYRSSRVGSRQVDGTVAAPLFAARHALDDAAEADLGAGLRSRVPLVVASVAGRTVPPGRTPAPTPGPFDAHDPDVRAAAVVIAWNVLQHFYPHFEALDVDWSAALSATIADVLDDRGPDDLTRTLQRMGARLQDAHVFVRGPGAAPAGIPARLARIEGRIVVVAAADGALRIGDRLLRIDGRAIDEAVAEAAALVSGSPARKDIVLLWYAALTFGRSGQAVRLTVERDGSSVELSIPRGEPPPGATGEPIRALAGGVVYVDLRRLEWPAIEAHWSELASSRGVVFDARGGAIDFVPLLGRLIRRGEPVEHPAFIPRILYPDRARSEELLFDDWSDLAAHEPRLAPPVAFLMDARSMSSDETLLAIVRGERLGVLVGEASAGANGNAIAIDLPGGFRFGFTGMRVPAPDGGRLHGLGLQPDVVASQTLADLRIGRDTAVERAREHLLNDARRGVTQHGPKARVSRPYEGGRS